MYIVVGLGNIGNDYKGTRHNTGFLAVDKIADALHVSGGKEKFRSVYIETNYKGEKVVLAKPTTFMNNSGFAVQDLMSWYKCEHSRLIVVYDDIELPAGDIRIRANGSAGTHNGMRSIIYENGFDDFPRVRVGVGRPQGDIINWVLGKPSPEDRELIDRATDDARDAVLLMIEGKLTDAQTKFNKKKSGKPKEQSDTDKPQEG